jgi:hypothetical protein
MLGNSQGVLRSLLSSYLEGLGASEGEVSAEWRDDVSKALHVEEELFVQFWAVHAKGAAGDIRVASNVLGDRVEHDVGSELNWVLQSW